MVEFRDCKGRLAATGDERTGMVENRYKGQKAKAVLSIGESFTIERDNIVTVITRVSDSHFRVNSYIQAA